MAFEIQFSPAAAVEIKDLKAFIAKRIVNEIERQLLHEPDQTVEEQEMPGQV